MSSKPFWSGSAPAKPMETKTPVEEKSNVIGASEHMIEFPIPLRRDLDVRISLPRDFKRSEAERIGRVLSALAAEDETPKATATPPPIVRPVT